MTWISDDLRHRLTSRAVLGLGRYGISPHLASHRLRGRPERVYRNCRSCFPCASQLRFPGSDEDAGSANLLIIFMVRAAGIEPALCQPELDFESSASTSSATPAPGAAIAIRTPAAARFICGSRSRLSAKSRASSPADPRRNPGMGIDYSAASFTGAGPARNCSSRPCCSALAALKCFVFTWP
jgi:hypothetical protein